MHEASVSKLTIPYTVCFYKSCSDKLWYSYLLLEGAQHYIMHIKRTNFFPPMIGWNWGQDTVSPNLNQYPDEYLISVLKIHSYKHLHAQKELMAVRAYVYIVKTSASRRARTIWYSEISVYTCDVRILTSFYAWWH